MRREKTNYIIQSVSHALDVLEQFSGEHDELGVTELSKRLKLHKNNVFRLLATLESRGYIEQNKATENYRLGIRCLQLGQTYVTQMGLLRQAHPIIETLAHAAHETAFVAVLRKTCRRAARRRRSGTAGANDSRIGEALPLHCTAAGKVQLAFIADAELRDALTDGLARFTDQHHHRAAVLAAAAREDRRARVLGGARRAIDEVHSIAVPIRDYTRNVVGSLAVSGPAYRMGSERIEKEIAPLMREGRSRAVESLGIRELNASRASASGWPATPRAIGAGVTLQTRP